MAIIYNRGEIKLQTLRLLDAAEDDEFIERVDSWFELAMQDIYSSLRAWWAVRAATATVEEDGTIVLPPSYLAMITVLPLDGTPPLELVTPEQSSRYWATGGGPTAYILEGLLMTLLPVQSADYSARFTYYSMLEPLNGDNDISMYTQRASSAVVYAAASHGAVYRGDLGLASQFANMAVARIDAINGETAKARFGQGVVMQRTNR
jgi:hypothetical protein